MKNLRLNLYKASTLESLSALLEKSKPTLSFLGGRAIKVEGFSGSVSIDTFAKKALSLFRSLRKKWDYSLEFRKKITLIEEKIDNSYYKTDTLLEKANVITKLFNWIRSLFSFFYSVRRDWNKGPSLSSCYSKKQFKEAFYYNNLPEEKDLTFKKINLYYPPYKTITPLHRRLLNAFLA